MNAQIIKLLEARWQLNFYILELNFKKKVKLIRISTQLRLIKQGLTFRSQNLMCSFTCNLNISYMIDSKSVGSVKQTVFKAKS